MVYGLVGAWVNIARLVLLASMVAATNATAETFRNGDYEFDVAPPPAWVVARDVPATWPADAPGANGAGWRNWLVDTQVDRRAGARVRYYDHAYEAVSAELLQEAGKKQIWFSPDYERLTVHRVQIRRDGVWQDRLVPRAVTLARRESEFERDMKTGAVSALIVLDDIRVGDVVRFSYTIAGDNPVLAGLIDEDFQFAANDALLDRHARVLFDPGTKLSLHVDRDAPSGGERQDHGFLEWSAHAHAQAAVVWEGSYPNWYPAWPRVVLGPQRRWADVAKWASGLYPPAKPLPADLEQRIAGWRELPSAGLRIAAALRVVQDDVRYFGTELGESTHRPTEPAETWTRRYGDCKDKARLLSTILRELGVDARPALVSIESGKAIADLPPAASLFDHVIVQARADGQVLWLDATQTQQRGAPDVRPAGNFGHALPVAADATALVAVASPASAIDRVRVSERLQPNAQGAGAVLQVETTYEGAAADRVRRYMIAHPIEETARRYLDLFRKRFGDVTVKTPLGVSDDDAANRYAVRQTLVLGNPWVGDSPGQQMFDAYNDMLADELALPHTAERTAPLAVGYPTEIEQRLELELLPGWRALSSPMARTLEDKAMSIEFKTEVSDKTLSVSRHYRARGDSLDPKDYPQHFALLREANELLGHRLVIGLPAAAAARERDQRLENLMRSIMDDAHKPSASGKH